MRYIIVAEDSSIYKTDTITDSERNAVESGILDVIDTKYMTQMTSEDGWVELEKWGY